MTSSVVHRNSHQICCNVVTVRWFHRRKDCNDFFIHWISWCCCKEKYIIQIIMSWYFQLFIKDECDLILEPQHQYPQQCQTCICFLFYLCDGFLMLFSKQLLRGVVKCLWWLSKGWECKVGILQISNLTPTTVLLLSNMCKVTTKGTLCLPLKMLRFLQHVKEYSISFPMTPNVWKFISEKWCLFLIIFLILYKPFCLISLNKPSRNKVPFFVIGHMSTYRILNHSFLHISHSLSHQSLYIPHQVITKLHLKVLSLFGVIVVQIVNFLHTDGRKIQRNNMNVHRLYWALGVAYQS